MTTTLILIAIIAVFIVLKKRKVKSSSWTGELIKKRVLSDEDDENHVYRLIFKIQNGKKITVSVSEDLYNHADIGEKYEKLSGDLIPKKIF